MTSHDDITWRLSIVSLPCVTGLLPAGQSEGLRTDASAWRPQCATAPYADLPSVLSQQY